ncbi:hypothetical protein D3C81_810360 [compost metagenome]
MLVALRIDAADQLDAVPAPGAGHPAAEGAAVDVAGHRVAHHRHAGGRVRIAQAEVVHHVVGVVVVDLRLEAVEGLADVGLLEAQAEAFALELAAVHAAPGIARLAVAGPGGQLEQGIGVRRPAQGHIGVPLVEARLHGIAVAVLVVVGLRAVGHDPRVTVLAAGGGVDAAVEAAVGAGQQAAVQAPVRLAELLRLALEQHGRRRGARPPQHALRALDHGQTVVAFRADVGARRVHASRAGAEHLAAVGQQLDPRAEHAAEHRIAVDPAVADGGEAGDGLQVVGAVAGRHRLARLLGIGHHGQRRLRCHAGDHQRRDLVFGGSGPLLQLSRLQRQRQHP